MSSIFWFFMNLHQSAEVPPIPLHNVYMRDYDSPVSKIALYMLQGNNRISLYIRRILAIPLVKSVVATGENLRENHEFRVWGSRKLKFTHVPPDWTTWDKYMGEIALDVYFSKKLSLFLQLWQLFSCTFCIGSIVSIISMGQSHVPESGNPSFWPVTSG